MKTISIMQPTYLPWLGYFELMFKSDQFVFFDDVQFIKKSWHQRNRIKTATGELLLVIPILSKGKRFQKINETLIHNNSGWAKKHLLTIENNYRKAPFFQNYIDELRVIYSKPYEKLSDLNIDLIIFLKNKIGIKTPTILSSELNIQGKKNERIIDICKALKSNVLYDAHGAKEILDLEFFNKEGIKLVFQNYQHPVYRQQYGDFIPLLSTLDLLFNEGDNSLSIIKSGGKQII